MANLSPMMQQYMEIKDQHKGDLVFFRLGDFYEMFFDDAIIASQELELTLTGRDCGLEERAPMCGVPYHSCDAYIKRLLEKGYKIAICEQVEEPTASTKLVKREVVRVITPGTVTDSKLLDEGKNNYICSVYTEKKGFGVSFADISTGEVFVSQTVTSKISLAMINELAKFSPSEILYNDMLLDYKEVGSFLKHKIQCISQVMETDWYEQERCQKELEEHFKVSHLEDLKLTDKPLIVKSLGVLIRYLKYTQKDCARRIIGISLYNEDQFMGLDFTARRNLELTENIRGENKKATLLAVLDKTKTSMGKRLMRQTVQQPLANYAQIVKRLNAVEALINQPIAYSEIQELLSKIFDLERFMTRIIYGTVSPRDLRAFLLTLYTLPDIKQLLQEMESPLLEDLNRKISSMVNLKTLIEQAIDDDPPNFVKDGGVIREGFHEELDALRNISKNGKEYILRLEEQEREKTGIKNLRINYNRVFGYYIEVTKSYLHLVPDEYIRKQTLANSERYIIQELKEYEEKVLTATEKIQKLEQELFSSVCGEIAKEIHRIQDTAGAVALLDVLCSFAKAASVNNYVKPDMAIDGVISIKDGRHPVVESVFAEPFVPNDTLLDVENNRMSIITGPNMAGKSTYMRQVALIVLMAQIGCFVPAKSAHITIVDKIFTRVGASDDLASGQSTFMVEMIEVAQILKGATKNSLVILDEIGRGTSTYDGMSIAKSVVEYIVQNKKIGCKTLFATHYHELSELEDTIPGIKNYNIAVKKRGDDITFLRKIVRGGTDDSYGIEVAKLAGVPQQVVSRAKEILLELESSERVVIKEVAVQQEDDPQLNLSAQYHGPVADKLKEVDLNTLTPIEAMNVLYELKTYVE